MRLNALTLPELMALQEAIALLQSAGAILAKLNDADSEVAMSINLTPGANAVIVTHFVMPPLVQVQEPDGEPVVIEDEPAVMPPAEHGAGGKTGSSVEHAESPPVAGTASMNGSGESPEPAAVNEAPAGEGSPAGIPPAPGAAPLSTPVVPKPPAKAKGAALRSGPFSEDEKTVLRKAIDSGRKSADVASELNRRPQIVATAMHNIAAAQRRAALKSPGAGADKRAEPAPVVAPAPAPDAAAAPIVDTPSSAPLKPSEPLWLDQTLSNRQREIAFALKELPRRRGFDVELDLEIVEGYSRGTKTNTLALDLDLDAKALAERFKELTACIHNKAGLMSFEEQGWLVKVLRRMVADARAMAGAA